MDKTLAVILGCVSCVTAAHARSIDREALNAALAAARAAGPCALAESIPARGGGLRLRFVPLGVRDPLAQAGVRTGDVLRAVDGRPVTHPADVTALYRAARTGVLPASLSVERRGRRLDLDFDRVDLQVWACAPQPAPPRTLPVYDDGRLVDYVGDFALSPRIVPAYRDGRAIGWKFVGVRPDSTAGRLGFRSSDLIVAIDGRAIEHVADVLTLKEEILAEAGPHQVEVERARARHMVEWWW